MGFQGVDLGPVDVLHDLLHLVVQHRQLFEQQFLGRFAVANRVETRVRAGQLQIVFKCFGKIGDVTFTKNPRLGISGDQKGYLALKFLAVRKGLKGRKTGQKGQLFLKTMTAQDVLHFSEPLI
jgi:hypothetical protein